MPATFDVAAFQPGLPAVQSLVTEYSGGRLLGGAGKMAQRFALQLLKEKGSMIYSPTEGSNFLFAVQRNILTELDIFIAFAAALANIGPLLQNEESDTDPKEERFAGAGIEKLNLYPGLVEIRIRVQSQAGTSDVVALPLTIN